MNRTDPPLSQPGGATCFHCGATNAANAQICFNCGALLSTPVVKTNPWRAALKVIITLVLSVAALGFGALGACIGFLGTIAGSDPTGAYGQGGAPTYLLAGGVLLASAFCAWLIWLVNKNL